MILTQYFLSDTSPLFDFFSASFKAAKTKKKHVLEMAGPLTTKAYHRLIKSVKFLMIFMHLCFKFPAGKGRDNISNSLFTCVCGDEFKARFQTWILFFVK